MSRRLWTLVAAAALLTLSPACETDNGKKFGEACTDDGDCQSNTCWEARCASWGLSCQPPTTLGSCDDQDDCSVDECAQVGKCFHTLDTGRAECLPRSAGTCVCGDAGVTIDAGTCTWADATQCSGWHSVAQQNGKDSMAAFASGTTLCAFDCCLTLKCP